jgi:hypothetical protein
MLIKRSLGYGNSIDGIEASYRIDNTPIEVKSLEEARSLCSAELGKALGYPITDDNSEDVSHGDGANIQVITGYYDSETGMRLTEAQIEALDGEDVDSGYVHYTYAAVSAELIKD